MLMVKVSGLVLVFSYFSCTICMFPNMVFYFILVIGKEAVNNQFTPKS
jgi:hypothetical protein